MTLLKMRFYMFPQRWSLVWISSVGLTHDNKICWLISKSDFLVGMFFLNWFEVKLVEIEEINYWYTHKGGQMI